MRIIIYLVHVSAFLISMGLSQLAGAQSDADLSTATKGATSDLAYPEDRLGRYGINDGTGLDTGCTFRSDGPLVVTIEVPATVNASKVNSDGTLKNPEKLVRDGLIGAEAVINFPVYDIDSAASVSGIAPEVDELYFNGEYKKNLSGLDNTWTNDSIRIPISQLRFRSTASPDATNTLEVFIDVANDGEEWCMSIDWVSVEFETAAPYVLVHGIAASADSWNEDNSPGVLKALDEYGVLYSVPSLIANGTTSENATKLYTEVNKFLEPISGRSVHVVAHSKGGLDSQRMAARYGRDLEVLSLSTFSTPYWGSAVADITAIVFDAVDKAQAEGKDPNGFLRKLVDGINIADTFGKGPRDPGLRALTTSRAISDHSAGVRGNISPTYVLAANADLNNNGDLDTLFGDEAAGLFDSGLQWSAQWSWDVMRNYVSAQAIRREQQLRTYGGRQVFVDVTIFRAQDAPNRPVSNDIVVTVPSALPSYGTSLGTVAANHSTMKTGANVKRFVDRTIRIRPDHD